MMIELTDTTKEIQHYALFGLLETYLVVFEMILYKLCYQSYMCRTDANCSICMLPVCVRSVLLRCTCQVAQA